MQLHYRVATLEAITVGDTEYTAEVSTNPQRPYQVAAKQNGFVDPRSLRTFHNPIDAITECQRQAQEAREREE